jgi:hypothetical protein
MYSDFQWRHDTQYDDIQHNGTQHNGHIATLSINDSQHYAMRNVAFFIVMLSVGMLSIVAPILATPRSLKVFKKIKVEYFNFVCET